MNRILLLEDDVSLIDGLVYSLKKNEFDVEVARTVCEAKQYLSELDRYDLLILDVRTIPFSAPTAGKIVRDRLYHYRSRSFSSLFLVSPKRC